MASNNKTTVTAEAGKQELFITREFDAPRELVFKAFSTPELIVRWLGPKEMKMRPDHFDMRDGGSYRYVSIAPDGMEYGFHGAIHEVTAPERIIQTFEFEGMPERGHVSFEIADFTALPNNRTKLVIQSVFRSAADRDGLICSGMERGVTDSHERLDDLLTKPL